MKLHAELAAAAEAAATATATAAAMASFANAGRRLRAKKATARDRWSEWKRENNKPRCCEESRCKGIQMLVLQRAQEE